MKTTSVFNLNALAVADKKRFIINQGGTSSSKTWSILQLLLMLAMKRSGILISIVSESLPHLRRGAMRDMMAMLDAEGMYSEKMHNKSANIFEIGDSRIEFFGADDSSKLRGARRDILYVNECNNISKGAFDELSVRTKENIIVDFNPVAEFWIHEFMQERPVDDYSYIKSTYKDNKYLDKNIIADIESRQFTDVNWWKVYGEGEIGNITGNIFTRWRIVDEMPESPKVCWGLDFGFSNDPTALTEVRYSDATLWIDELCYQTHLTNYDIVALVKGIDGWKSATIVGDSAEPKSIEEIKMAGIRIIGADKGADSVRNGIDLMQQVDIAITRRSINVIKEFRNYRWKVDKNGKGQNVPIDIWNHAIDSIRYASSNMLMSRNRTHINRITIPSN